MKEWSISILMKRKTEIERNLYFKRNRLYIISKQVSPDCELACLLREACLLLIAQLNRIKAKVKTELT